MTPQYNFFKTKYGNELLIDVVDLKAIKRYLSDRVLHSLTYYDITIITEGEGLFQIDDVKQDAKERDVLFSQPYQLREWDTQHIINGYALIFEEDFLLSFFNDSHFLDNISYFNKNRSNNKLSLSVVEFEQIIILIRQIKHEINGYTVKNKHILRALLYQTLMQLDRIFMEQNPIFPDTPKNSHVARFLSLVNSDFKQNHTVRHYADRLFLTPNYLNELVKKETGTSVKTHIHSKLITETKKLLLYSNLSVTEISEHLCFETPSYFIRFFRKYAGCTPLRFRQTEKP